MALITSGRRRRVRAAASAGAADCRGAHHRGHSPCSKCRPPSDILAVFTSYLFCQFHAGRGGSSCCGADRPRARGAGREPPPSPCAAALNRWATLTNPPAWHLFSWALYSLAQFRCLSLLYIGLSPLFLALPLPFTAFHWPSTALPCASAAALPKTSALVVLRPVGNERRNSAGRAFRLQV